MTNLEILETQYKWVKESRQVLLDYCQTISAEDFVRPSSSFGRGGTINSLLVHIANTYKFWIANKALGKNVEYMSYTVQQTLGEVEKLFEETDDYITEFFEKYGEKLFDNISFELGERKSNASAFKLFSHVITHEFHHKGQILSLSRELGYIPVDTDLIR